MGPTDKLIVVVDGSLPPGLQIPQAIHAFRQFVEEHPEIERAWFGQSNYLAVLRTKDRAELEVLVYKATVEEVRFSKFHEPDLAPAGCAGAAGPLTAIAIEPGDRSRRLCRGYDLALT